MNPDTLRFVTNCYICTGILTGIIFIALNSPKPPRCLVTRSTVFTIYGLLAWLAGLGLAAIWSFDDDIRRAAFGDTMRPAFVMIAITVVIAKVGLLLFFLARRWKRLLKGCL